MAFLRRTRNFLKGLLPIADCLMVPLLIPSGYFLKMIRRLGVHRLPICRRALLLIGVFPIRDHYYEPIFDLRHVCSRSRTIQNLAAIDWNVDGQLASLTNLVYHDELPSLLNRTDTLSPFVVKNAMFEAGDADYWYQTIRQRKPKRIFEVGSGNSSIVALRAIQKNQEDDHNYKCELVCIEPYEAPWLESTGAQVMRKRLEEIELDFFSQLTSNDILFIDSSHVIKPGGDVTYAYLEILPSLRPGVLVHIHDIFSPRHYRSDWMNEKILLWNEQYLLEAFLSYNEDWIIVAALNFLHHNHFAALKLVCPFLNESDEPGSFYIQKLS